MFDPAHLAKFSFSQRAYFGRALVAKVGGLGFVHLSLAIKIFAVLFPLFPVFLHPFPEIIAGLIGRLEFFLPLCGFGHKMLLSVSRVNRIGRWLDRFFFLRHGNAHGKENCKKKCRAAPHPVKVRIKDLMWAAHRHCGFDHAGQCLMWHTLQ